MGVRRQINRDELLRADLKRFVRFYSREELAEKIAEYISDNFYQKMPADKLSSYQVKKEVVLKLLCKHFGVEMQQVVTKTRRKNIVYPRQVMHFFLATRTCLSLKEIGEIFNQDHTTVMSSRNKITGLMNKNPMVMEEMKLLTQRLKRRIN